MPTLTPIIGKRHSHIATLAASVFLVAILFQLGHFFEHILQAGAWLIGYREAPYMTEFGMHLMHTLGAVGFPAETAARQSLLGFELLHLLGNAIFALGTTGLLFFIRTKVMKLAAAIQLFHLYEHISLFASAYFISQSIGLSTLFGLPLQDTTSVAYRVWWHFFFNAIPTTLVLYTLWRTYKK